MMAMVFCLCHTEFLCYELMLFELDLTHDFCSVFCFACFLRDSLAGGLALHFFFIFLFLLF